MHGLFWSLYIRARPQWKRTDETEREKELATAIREARPYLVLVPLSVLNRIHNVKATPLMDCNLQVARGNIKHSLTITYHPSRKRLTPHLALHVCPFTSSGLHRRRYALVRLISRLAASSPTCSSRKESPQLKMAWWNYYLACNLHCGHDRKGTGMIWDCHAGNLGGPFLELWIACRMMFVLQLLGESIIGLGQASSSIFDTLLLVAECQYTWELLRSVSYLCVSTCILGNADVHSPRLFIRSPDWRSLSETTYKDIRSRISQPHISTLKSNTPHFYF